MSEEYNNVKTVCWLCLNFLYLLCMSRAIASVYVWHGELMSEPTGIG